MSRGKIFQLLFFLIPVITASVADLLKCGSHEFQHGSKCCKQCPPGTRVINQCGERSDTICGPCEKGSFQKDWNNSTSCQKCNMWKCTKGKKLALLCNATRDNECRCDSKTQYFNLGFDFCVNCEPCAAGTYPDVPCIENTKCETCPKNYFSNISKNIRSPCQRCRKCRYYRTRCRRTHDAVCDDRRQETTANMSSRISTKGNDITISTTATTKNARNKDGDDEGLIKKYIIPIVILPVVLFLAIAAIFYIVKHAHPCRKGKYFLKLKTQKCEKLNTGGLLFRELPAKVHLKLHQLLCSSYSKNWKHLAAELQAFEWPEILSFEADKKTSAEAMLTSWGTSNSATVDRLHEALVKIGREDVANFLATNIPERPDSPCPV